MKIFNDKKIIVLTVILMVFTISYFVIANKISYAFDTDYNIEKHYNMVINTIKKSSIEYANKEKDLFKEEDIIYIKVQDLIDKKYLIANEKGNIMNPLKKDETLNDKIIKIKKEEGKIEVTIDN